MQCSSRQPVTVLCNPICCLTGLAVAHKCGRCNVLSLQHQYDRHARKPANKQTQSAVISCKCSSTKLSLPTGSSKLHAAMPVTAQAQQFEHAPDNGITAEKGLLAVIHRHPSSLNTLLSMGLMTQTTQSPDSTIVLTASIISMQQWQ